MWVVTVISPWAEPREYVLKAGKTTLGRHPGNDIVIPDDASSRLHAEIDYELFSNAIDVRDLDSTNGTWVLTDGGDTFRVTREEITLAGSGRILPGRQSLEPLRYRVGPQTQA